MQELIFDAVTNVTCFLIWLSDRFFGIPSASLVWLGQKTRVVIAQIGFFIMRLIDPSKTEAAELEAENDPVELATQGMELKLLSAAYKVRDHAIETGDWTDHHSDAIEAVGNALLLDIGWEEEHIHAHLKAVVESIDGLEYDVFPEGEG
jgi:hypothetical protein